MRISTKLTLNSLVVLVLLLTSVAVSLYYSDKIKGNVRQLVEIKLPLQKTVGEMEIKVRKVAEIAVHFALSPDDRDLGFIDATKRQFEQHERDFKRLADTDEELTLGRKILVIYQEIKRLSTDVTTMAVRRTVDLELLRNDVAALDVLIDKKSRPILGRIDRGALIKLDAAIEMKASIGEIFTAIAAYNLYAGQDINKNVALAKKHFLAFKILLLGAHLSVAELDFLVSADKLFTDISTYVAEITALTVRLDAVLQKIQDRLEEFDRLADVEIPNLILKETERAALDASESADLAITVNIIIGLAVFAIIAGSAWIVSKDIIDVAKRLNDGAMAFGRGDLDYRIAARTTDELGQLARTFNGMADRIKIEEEALKDSEENLRTTLDSIGDAVITTDTAGNVTRMNPVAAKLTGWELRQAEGQPLAEVFHIVNAKTRAPVNNPVSEVLEHGKIVDLANHTILVARNGTESHIADSGAPIRDDNGDITGVVLVFRDVTEQLRLKEMMIQSEKMLSVGGLAAGMAHEINNPLAGMMQTANVMKSRLTSKDTPANLKAAQMAGASMDAIQAYMEDRGILRMIATINTSGRRVADIVDNMLSFARKSDAVSSTHDVAQLLDRTLELASTDYDLKKQFDFKTIVIIKEYTEDLPSVPCEGAKIQQVLLNILRNGAEAMQEAGVKKPSFTLRTLYQPEAGSVCIEIEDNGPGMDEATRKRIFEPFFTTKPVGVGTGLGLSVSYFIIKENHGGEMSVESEPGQGARFIITLPLAGVAELS